MSLFTLRIVTSSIQLIIVTSLRDDTLNLESAIFNSYYAYSKWPSSWKQKTGSNPCRDWLILILFQNINDTGRFNIKNSPVAILVVEFRLYIEFIVSEVSWSTESYRDYCN